MQTLFTTILPVLMSFFAPSEHNSAETVLIRDLSYIDGVYYHDHHVFNGDIVDYYENDKLKFRYGVLDGRLNGKATEFYPSGKVKSIRHYVISKLFGDFVEYYESGEIRASFKVKLNAYKQGEIVENITIGKLKKGKIKTRTYDTGVIYFIGNEGQIYESSEIISILNQTTYRLTSASGEKVLLQMN